MQIKDSDKVWDQHLSEPLLIEPEEVYSYNIKNLHTNVGNDFRIVVRAIGDNIVSDEISSDWIVWESIPE